MNDPFFTVGMGASAGGQKSLCEFFDHITVCENVAFVVITHLLRERRSILNEILARHTSLPVIRVENDMLILPGNIYVMAENTTVELNKGWLRIKTRDTRIENDAVDVFFTSLANDFKEKAIGIILSGGGKDGLKGSLQINHMGGSVIVEDPESAEVKGMPLSIVNWDHPTVIRKPAQLAMELNLLCGL